VAFGSCSEAVPVSVLLICVIDVVVSTDIIITDFDQSLHLVSKGNQVNIPEPGGGYRTVTSY